MLNRQELDQAAYIFRVIWVLHCRVFTPCCIIRRKVQAFGKGYMPISIRGFIVDTCMFNRSQAFGKDDNQILIECFIFKYNQSFIFQIPEKSGDGENDVDVKSEREFNGPIENRECRDVIFLLIFLLFLGGLVCKVFVHP